MGRSLYPAHKPTNVIKSTFSNLPVYYMLLFPIPASIVDKLECIKRNFLLEDCEAGKKFHLVEWDSLKFPKDKAELERHSHSLLTVAKRMDYHLSEEIRCILDDQTPPKLIGDEAIVDAPPPKLISGGEAIVDTPIGGLVGTQLSVGNEEMPAPQPSDVDEGRRNRRGRRSGTDQRPPWLPEGWIIMTRKRQNGRTAGHVDKYYVRPDGRRFRSKREVEDCIRRSIANPIQGQP